MLHFGKLDQHIPRQDVDKVQALHPEISIFWYDAGHRLQLQRARELQRGCGQTGSRAFSGISETALGAVDMHLLELCPSKCKSPTQASLEWGTQ